jgi:hypothetical protein
MIISTGTIAATGGPMVTMFRHRFHQILRLLLFPTFAKEVEHCRIHYLWPIGDDLDIISTGHHAATGDPLFHCLTASISVVSSGSQSESHHCRIHTAEPSVNDINWKNVRLALS